MQLQLSADRRENFWRAGLSPEEDSVKRSQLGMKEAKRAKSLILKRGPDRRGNVISIIKPPKGVENIFLAEIITVTEA